MSYALKDTYRVYPRALAMLDRAGTAYSRFSGDPQNKPMAYVLRFGRRYAAIPTNGNATWGGKRAAPPIP